MVAHDILARGTDLTDTGNWQRPVIRQMHDEDFPARFLQDLATEAKPKISSLSALTSSAASGSAAPVLFQPVQRMVNVALIRVNCNSPGIPRLDPTRVMSAGVVVRRVVRRASPTGGAAYDDHGSLAGWMRNAQGQCNWVAFTPTTECLDPDPRQRPPLRSGDAAVDRQLATMMSTTALTESVTPAFVAPPATCAAINRTVLYAVIPTASSEVSDSPPQAPAIPPAQLLSALPALLRAASSTSPPAVPAPNSAIDYRWLSGDWLNTPSGSGGSPPLTSVEIDDFQPFTLALRMLDGVFGAFDGSTDGKAILAILNRHRVGFADPAIASMGMGDFYAAAKSVLFDVSADSVGSGAPPTVTMPDAWDWLDGNDQNDLLAQMLAALVPRAKALLAPIGRFQDSTRLYRLRVFVRVKGDKPGCPPHLIWSEYSEEFRIAAWHENGERAHPPVPLPDITSAFVRNAKPNCSFQVPGNLMQATQNSSLSGVMKGGGGGLSLGWICGFNIPMITICAFFVLNIFLSLLNIVFFWLPFIKICIPYPSTNSDPD